MMILITIIFSFMLGLGLSYLYYKYTNRLKVMHNSVYDNMLTQNLTGFIIKDKLLTTWVMIDQYDN
jgi:ABC-type Mn2+/Zn2+ transport system permease subunit